MEQLPRLPLVRLGEVGDRAAVAGMLRDFHAAAALPFEFSTPWAAGLFTQHCSSSDRIALVLDVNGLAHGVLLAVAGNSPLGPFRIAQELAWWVQPASRGGGSAMLDAYEAWATERKCAFAGVTSLAAFPRTDAIYQRRGYQPVETHFIKALPTARR